jgi:Flp pilus assembly protein TadD
VPLAAPALRDPLRAVRHSAAHALADAPREALDAIAGADLDAALDELAAAERLLADRPESRLNLALLLARLGQPDAAEAELRASLALDPRCVPALVNLADLCRELGREAEGEAFLGQALEHEPGNAAALHALGLLRVRQGRHADALELLVRAARAESRNPRFAFVHAVALDGAGERARAIGVLQDASARWPADRDVLSTLAMWLAEAGDAAAARTVAGQLVTLLPGDPQAEALLAAVQGAALR